MAATAFLIMGVLAAVAGVDAIGVNWGTQASHVLPPATVAQMLKDNGFAKVKLFDADAGVLSALRNTGVQVAVGIPNDLLAGLAGGESAAQDWVSKNLSSYASSGVDIRLVAVGNEPFLDSWNGSYLATTLPALRNVQAALIKAGLAGRVKATVPFNADVYTSATGKPSDGDFRADIHSLMVEIVQFLSDNGAPFMANIYPFISLYRDPHFPVDYAFFSGSSAPVVDGSITYENVFDANHDTLVAALQRNGYGNVSIIVGEIGWPTDGDANANLQYAQKFNQGLISHIASGRGTPLRSGAAVDAYLFSLVDEDTKSIQPGNFERHWGVFFYDGRPKYQLDVRGGGSGGLVAAKGVQYLPRQWCVFRAASLDDGNVAPSVSYACANADCTSLGYRTSCAGLDAVGNISYAFNSYYQMNDQDDRACGFDGLAAVTKEDPSTPECRFIVEIAVAESGAGCGAAPRRLLPLLLALALFLVLA